MKEDDDVPQYRSLGMLGPQIKATESKTANTAPVGTARHRVLSTTDRGCSITVLDDSGKMMFIHCGLGPNNLLEKLCTLKSPVPDTDNEIDMKDALSIIFFDCSWTLNGQQKTKKDEHKKITRSGTVTGNNYDELVLDDTEQVMWMFCTITCT
jgi:hypothetical protein